LHSEWLPDLKAYANPSAEVGGLSGALIPRDLLLHVNPHSIHQRISDSDRILIIGGGLKAVETAAQCVTAFSPPKEVTIVSSGPSLCPFVTPETDVAIRNWLTDHGVRLELGEEVALNRKMLDSLEFSHIAPIQLRYSRRLLSVDRVANMVAIPNTVPLFVFHTRIVDDDGLISVPPRSPCMSSHVDIL